MIKRLFEKLTLKSFTILSIISYILVIFLATRLGIFSISTISHAFGYHSDYSFSLIGYLLFCYPTIYGAVAVRLTQNTNIQGRLRLFMMISYIINLIIVGIMILEGNSWGGGIYFTSISDGSMCIQTLISTVVWWIGMSYGNK